MSQMHLQARTTPRMRVEIKSSASQLAELAKRYNIMKATAHKWKSREMTEDRSHRPHRLCTTLTTAQEAFVGELRRLLLLPLDVLLVVCREFINPAVSRSGLDRCLQRHGVGSLRELQAEAPPKSFKDYEPGFVHVDSKNLPQMPDETALRYLFVAIDRATRWVYLRIYARQDEAAATKFLRRPCDAAPMKIQTVLTDNGSQFTDRFTSKAKQPSARLRQRCATLPSSTASVRHATRRPTAWSSASTAASQTRFKSAEELETTLKHYMTMYNHRIPQTALQQWQTQRPELFRKRVYEQAGLDIYTGKCIC